MRQFSQDEQTLMAQIGRQYPEFGALLQRARTSELELLALTSNEFFPIQKGRIGMLTEILKHVVTQTP